MENLVNRIFLYAFFLLILSCNKTICMEERINMQNKKLKSNEKLHEEFSLPSLTTSKKPIFRKTSKPNLKKYEKKRLIFPVLVEKVREKHNFEFEGTRSPENSPESPPLEKEQIINFECTRSPENSPDSPPSKKERAISLELDNEILEKAKTELQTELKKANHFKPNRLIPEFEENLTNKRPLTRKKSNLELLDEVDLEFKIVSETDDIRNKIKKILTIVGTSFFCDVRGFTCFSNECPKVEDPAKFMLDITELAEKIVTEWGGYIIGIAGDAHLGFFPKSKHENSLKNSVLNCFLCSIEFVIKSLELMKEKKEEYFPKQCDLGIEAGPICFYGLTKNNEVLKLAVASSIVNFAQRLEDNAKNSTELNTRKITLTEEKYNLIGVLKKIREIFGPKYLLQAKGIKGRPFVYSCSLENIIKFYKSQEWIRYKEKALERIEKNKPVKNLEKLFVLFKRKANIRANEQLMNN